jgi:hypothetical protein
MKKYLLFLLTNFFFFALLSQDIIIPEYIKEFYQKLEIMHNEHEKFVKNPDNPDLLDALITAYEDVFTMEFSEKVYGYLYVGYADLLVQKGDYELAFEYYDLAYDLKKLTAEEFGYPVHRQYFEKDPLLLHEYNKKKREYEDNTKNYYTPREQEVRTKIEQMLEADQFARNNYLDYPNIIPHTDSITMADLVYLLERYPEYNDPLRDIYPFAGIIIYRHIFTAYPDFWLAYFEPKAKKELTTGEYGAQTYARTYDRCMITSGKAEYSYYGEWDNDGKNVNPDSEAVDKRRVNLGLPLLKDKPSDEGKFFITY